MRNEKIRMMTLDALFIAMMIVVYFLQFAFVLIFPAFSITILHIFVVIVALLGGYKRSWVLGLTFGILSLIMAYVAPKSLLDPLFQNPLVSVLPRLLFGLISGYLASLFINKVKDNKVQLTIYSAIIAAISTLIHTVLVIGSIYIFYNDIAVSELSPNFFEFIYLIITANGIIEISLAAIITPLVVTPLYKYSRKYYEPIKSR
jgi:uncharacterized membrane protein